MYNRPSQVAPVYKSVIRATSDMIDDFNAAGNFGTIAYHNWEERGLEKDLPPITLIGLDGFSFAENQGLWNIRYAMAVSSFHDLNLLTEIEIVDAVQQRFGEGEKVNLYDLASGTIVSQLVVSAFQVLPMAQSEVRNYRTIGIELHRTSV